MKKIWTLSILLLMLLSSMLHAQKTIFDRLSSPDTLSQAKVNIYQDQRINQLFSPQKTQSGNLLQSTGNGHRVQVFSSNTQRTAKTEAFLIEKRIKEAFPDYPVYVSYTSPFWKVRVGDFTSAREAQEFLSKVLVQFPELKGSAYTVRDQIILNANK